MQMVKVDEANGNKGSLGRQFVMQAVAQVPFLFISNWCLIITL
jgi:hypothetical protein